MQKINNSLIIGSILVGLAVCLGAFGAHGLKDIVSEKAMNTFQTGVTYHYYHAFGLLFLGLLKIQLPELKEKFTSLAFIVGILLFSVNCYLYAVTQVKTFAMIVPLGGVLFILGWFYLGFQLFKGKK